MSNEHNPVAHLITKIQQHWVEQITTDPDCRMIRWLISPDEASLYQGFLQVESTSDGTVPELVVTQLTPLKSAETFSADLINTFVSIVERDTKAGEPYVHSPWLRPELTNDNKSEKDLLNLISSFHQRFLPKKRKLVLALMPQAVCSPKAYEQWIHAMLKLTIPDGVSILVFDFVDDTHFDQLFADWAPVTKTVSLPLYLDKAIKKMGSTGNPLLVNAQFHHYLFKMSEAVQGGNINRLNAAGRECITKMLKGGSMALTATSHIAYAGMLFHFKAYDQSKQLLLKGLAYAKKGTALNDNTCTPLLTQFYGYLASCNQLNKNYPEAIADYNRQAEEAIVCGSPLLAITAWRQAAILAKKYDRDRYTEIIQKSFECGKKVRKEDLMYSDYCFTGLEYHEMLSGLKAFEECAQTNEWMSEIYGRDWKETTEKKLALTQSKKPIFTTLHNTPHLPVEHI